MVCGRENTALGAASPRKLRSKSKQQSTDSRTVTVPMSTRKTRSGKRLSAENPENLKSVSSVPQELPDPERLMRKKRKFATERSAAASTREEPHGLVESDLVEVLSDHSSPKYWIPIMICFLLGQTWSEASQVISKRWVGVNGAPTVEYLVLFADKSRSWEPEQNVKLNKHTRVDAISQHIFL